MKIWNKIRKNELVCLISLLAALMYGMYYMDIMDPLAYSLSEIGRYNTALFVVWAVLSGVALFFNVNRAYDRLHYKSKMGSALWYTGLGFLVLTFLNMSREPVFYWIHVSTAILFSVLGFGSIVMPLLYMFKRNKKYKIMTIIFFSLVFVDVVFLAIFKQMALYEFIPLMLGYIVLFFINYTETFNVMKK